MKAGDTVRLTRGPYSQERATIVRLVTVRDGLPGTWYILKLENDLTVTAHEQYVERIEEGAACLPQ